MSGRSDKTNAPVVTESLDGAAVGARTKPSKPVQIWAVIGGAILIFQLYVWIRWVTGPYFERVPAGPSDPPSYMKVILTANVVLMWVWAPIALWLFIIRPWRRERRITLDGMLVASMGLMFFQDPLLNYVNTWCTYNAWLFNLGSCSSNIPGWVSPEEPGHQVPEPLLTNAPGYTFGVLLITIAGCWVMRRIKARWPKMSNLQLIGVTYLIAILFDFVHGGLHHPAGRDVLLSRCHPIRVDQRRPLLPVAHLRRIDVGRRPGGPVLSALLHRRS
ncbi:spirocyclase AveC family protein [Actinomadura scrupuli]|uniref:spirocyclase AveC family protein n=1 Tax=Actinomadura scrupuli TaxID=559629 RepID=UPI003D95619B